jgi:hypothetical protein
LGKEVNMFISGFFLLLLFVSIFSMSEHIRIYLLVTSSYARNIFVEQTKLNSFYFQKFAFLQRDWLGFDAIHSCCCLGRKMRFILNFSMKNMYNNITMTLLSY